jgi:phosphoenolpyruvate carboxylase
MRRTGELISAVFGSSCNQRRPRMVKTLKMREAGLRRLHRHQVQLLATWRGHLAAGHKDRADELTPAVLLSINAISAGLRTTG